MTYLRVIPRDLFNEAKLLKCLGKLSLLIHDGANVPKGLLLDHLTEENEGFEICQNESDGSLYVSNLELTHKGRTIGLRCPYNHKGAYPLQLCFEDEEGSVFNDDGSLSDEFQALLKSI